MKLKEYLYSQLTHSFFPVFFGLFFITSIVFLVKISQLTSIITIDFLELLTLYSYVIPSILFYTLPISFFISLVICLSKLSSEYELLVISSFGLNPIKILKVFFPITLLVSISLLIISVGLIPKTKYLTSVMLNQKKKEANFNIKSSEFGQKFGDWLIYIEDEQDKSYKELKLFKTDDKSEQFIIAKSANLTNNRGELNFELSKGASYYIKDNEINQIDFSKMSINDSIADSKIEEFKDSISYWKRKFEQKDDIDKLSFYTLTSLFPTLSLLLVVALGYFNPRYEKNRSVAFGVLGAVIFYVLADFLAKKLLLNSLVVLPLLWLGVTYYIYIKKIKRVY